MDADSQIITAIDVLPVSTDEAMSAVQFIAHEEQVHGNDVQALSMDGAGFHGEALRTLTDPEGLNLDVYVPPPKQTQEYFRPEQFTLDETGAKLTCPAGQTTTYRRRNSHDRGWQFLFKRRQCAGCPLQAQCLKQLPKNGGRAVQKSDYEKEYQAARQKAGTESYRQVRREHHQVERKLGELARWHRLRRGRYRGRWRLRIQGMLTGMVVNIKRIVSLLSLDAGGGGAVRAELAATG
jgi:hypothetical protein